jgi:Sec-independent protein translocase protein TatA
MNPSSAVASLTMKVVGLLLIVSSLLDYIILAIPLQLLNRQWQLGYTTQLVDRGVIPLMGVALLLLGFWIESNSGTSKGSRAPFLDLRFWGLIFSTVFGVVFLLLFPLHLNNVRLERSSALQTIREEAAQQEAVLAQRLGSNQGQQQISQIQTQFKDQLQKLISDDEQLKQRLASEDVSEQEKQLLQTFQENPSNLDQFVDQRFSAEAIQTQQLTEIRSRREEREKQAKIRSVKSGLQTGISSLLLAVSYSAIGWTGLKNLGFIGGRPSGRPR